MGSRQGTSTTVVWRSGPTEPGPKRLYEPGSSALFRRPKSEPQTSADRAADDASPAARKKGRPTPSRREAEAANKAKAKVPRTRKEIAAARRLARADSSTKVRQAMRSGDDQYLPARDRGPVRRFIRDYVDAS